MLFDKLPREGPQAGHQAEVFLVEAAILVVRNDPIVPSASRLRKMGQATLLPEEA